MKKENKKQVSLLKINGDTLQGGFKSLDDLQKRKIKAGGANWWSCSNFFCWGRN